MKGILIQQKVFKAISGKYPENISEEKILENDEYAYSSIILNLSDSMIRKVDDNINEFTKLIQDIKLTGDESIDEYSPIVLLNAIPDTYSDVKSAIKYGRDSVNLETVITGLKSRKIDLKTNILSQNHNEVNVVRGKGKYRDNRNNHDKRGKNRSRSRSESNDRDEK
ncbi:UNVERIFIED_CONTAM: hypothetical protein Sradi_2315300 [Sesamum radiatum]|uniref:Retrovirus-related Pol polyprotein from transposon TNT 1-94 n=1 Tax=Sesamum radiatum TaxID=300843 RepID=A0AAW2T5N9_SESRA